MSPPYKAAVAVSASTLPACLHGLYTAAVYLLSRPFFVLAGPLHCGGGGRTGPHHSPADYRLIFYPVSAFCLPLCHRHHTGPVGFKSQVVQANCSHGLFLCLCLYLWHQLCAYSLLTSRHFLHLTIPPPHDMACEDCVMKWGYYHSCQFCVFKALLCEKHAAASTLFLSCS